MRIKARAQNLPGDPGAWQPGGPLWRRAPTRDTEGRLYNDFMMYAPGLNRRSPAEQEAVAILVRGVLAQYDGEVVFAELNLKINALWVSLENRRGLMAELVTALRRQVPEFHLVGHNPLAGTSGGRIP